MNSPVAASVEYSKANETSFRLYVDSEFANTYRKDANLILPHGKVLGFTGSGKQVVFGLNGSDDFTISINGATALTFATSGDLDALEASITIELAEIDDKLVGSFGFALDVNGRVSSLKLLSDGTTSGIRFAADVLEFYDGITDRPLFSAAAGVFTINGDLLVGGSILVGVTKLQVGLQSLIYLQSDGDAIEWASGASIGSIPESTIEYLGVDLLLSGETYDIRLTDVTDTGASVRAKILTPGATALQQETTDSAGGGGNPTRVMHKPTVDDSYVGQYTFSFTGTITVVSTAALGGYFHSGYVTFSTWFNDGGGWDEGPSITIAAATLFGSFGPSDLSGVQSFGTWIGTVNWSPPIGQHGGQEFGISVKASEHGGAVTDLTKVSYTTQASTGERTATPNGEQVKITVFPRNA